MATPAPRPARGLSDMELVELAGLGDRRSLGELARRHGLSVEVLLLRAGAAPSLASRLARRAFLDAFERIAELRGRGGAFAPWVRRLAARRYLERRAYESALASATGPAEGDVRIADEPCDLDLDAALLALAPNARLYVSACYGAGFTTREAAEATKHSLEALRVELHRAVDILRSRLDFGVAEYASGEFERRLERALVASAPSIPGEDVARDNFAHDVERRLARVWALRRLAIGLAGVVSALIAVWRIASSSLATRLEATVRSPFALLLRRINSLEAEVPLLRLLPFSADAFWLLAGLALLAAGLAATRMFDER